ncbi:Sec-independent protein translocase subunit TatA/TatB [Pseudomonas oryzicola]|uniref:Uncharacterized protein n=1 Tax=Pseudomonas oryzicola TaxID=485876 RepID=A0ABS6QFG4_9PSED|nr:hypothetical protein [Pseudomonas oryzicola]MBV4492699.1 hypothetical protein [Pseudomonas oryzicola]
MLEAGFSERLPVGIVALLVLGTVRLSLAACNLGRGDARVTRTVGARG